MPGCRTSSRHIPGVEFPSRSHPGVLATAPSAELLAAWTKRETALDMQLMGHGHTPLPDAVGAYVNQEGLSEELLDRIRKEGARTGPSREVSKAT